jgi:hypothetical protein
MSEAEILKGAKTEVAFVDALHSSPQSDSSRTSAMTSRIVAGIGKDHDADRLLGGANAPKFELVAAAGDGTFQRTQANSDMQQDIKKMLTAAISGDKWGAAADVWRKAFQSELDVKNTTPQNVAQGLNIIGAAINGKVSADLSKIPGRIPEPVGMAVTEEDGKFYFYMMLNKDKAALAKNHASIATGTESDTVIKLGPFEPGKPGQKL